MITHILSFDVVMKFLMWVIITHTADLYKDRVSSFLSINWPTSDVLKSHTHTPTHTHTNIIQLQHTFHRSEAGNLINLGGLKTFQMISDNKYNHCALLLQNSTYVSQIKRIGCCNREMTHFAYTWETPISLLSIVSKVLERLIFSKIIEIKTNRYAANKEFTN